jgi:hypothetical protein
LSRLLKRFQQPIQRRVLLHFDIERESKDATSPFILRVIALHCVQILVVSIGESQSHVERFSSFDLGQMHLQNHLKQFQLRNQYNLLKL